MNRFIQLILGFKRLREKLVGEQDPTLFRMAKTWASDLQPGLVSLRAVMYKGFAATSLGLVVRKPKII